MLCASFAELRAIHFIPDTFQYSGIKMNATLIYVCSIYGWYLYFVAHSHSPKFGRQQKIEGSFKGKAFKGVLADKL